MFRMAVSSLHSSLATCGVPARLLSSRASSARGGGSRLVRPVPSGVRPLGARRAVGVSPPAALARPARTLVVSADGAAAPKKGKGKGRKGKKEENVYGHTVLLPKTTFEMRANSVTKEPAIQQFWSDERVYEQIAEREDAELFTLHDGPPYANGDLHIGHALNKILKDFINRHEALKGKRVRYVPGWDCHGLPIELKVLQSMDADRRKELTPIKLRKKARAFALKTVDAQREQFKRYGVWGDWADPYLTLLPEYEAAQLEVFGKMFLNGHVYRGKKPVHWSPSSMTALAEAELEYPEGHVSQSVYVAFPLDPSSAKDAFPEEHRAHLDGASLAVWTTTPWTMPANAAVAVNDQLDYALVEVVAAKEGSEEDGSDASSEDGSEASSGPSSASLVGKTLVVAEGLVSEVAAKLGVEMKTLCVVKGAALEGMTYTHPMYDRASPVVVGGDYITTESGTGLVHTAPGHGQEDYLTGVKHGLPLLSPVDDRGDFTADAGAALEGKNVLGEGNDACIAALAESGALLLREAYGHKYPYDWRTKKPTIFRATSQWFASVEGFRDDALRELDGIEFIPASGAKRMRPMVSGRNDWCISRQRSWGVPIPCFYDKETQEPLMDAATIAHVTEIVREKGTDAWWELDIADLLPEEYKDRADALTKGTDTMDVWFDSGSSWAGVVKSRGLKFPADMYLEGSDQHRGWFQSSLLTGVAAEGVAPYKTILTHGFVLDEKGYKMSKSLGNVVDPRLVIEGGKNQKQEPAFGADTLRLWVASTDYTSDVLIGGNILKQTSDAYRKLRGTIRFLMGNVNDFNPAEDAVPYDELPAFDKYVLRKTADAIDAMDRAYETYSYSTAVSALFSFTAFLSNVYLDVSKDRLYVEAPEGKQRRDAQTVVAHVLEALVAAVAPVTPHLAEEAYAAFPYPRAAKSVFLEGWKAPLDEWRDGVSDEEIAFWNKATAARGEANRAIEAARGEKLVGASLEAKIVLHAADEAFAAQLRSRVEELKPFFIVSELEVADSAEEVTSVCGATSELKGAEAEAAGLGADGIIAGVTKAGGAKCARCWGFFTGLGSDARHPELCERCTKIVVEVDPEFTPPAKATAEAEATV